jgi:hypothetical protein
MARIFIIVLMILIVSSCTDNTSGNDQPPQRVRWIQKTPDTFSGPERGIDAVGEFPGKIQLEWKEPSEKDVKKFLLYVSVDNVNFLNEKILKIDEANKNQNFRYNTSDSSFIFLYDIQEMDHGIGDPYNKPFYFYMRAEDEIGQLSEPSDTIYYKLEKPISGLAVYIDTNQDTLLTWGWSNLQLPPNNLIIRIEKKILPSRWEVKFVKLFAADDPIFRNQFFDNPSVFIKDLRIVYGIFDTNGEYRWRVDVYYDEYWGSESNWQLITIQ